MCKQLKGRRLRIIFGADRLLAWDGGGEDLADAGNLASNQLI